MDGRAYELAHSLLDLALVLEHFRPGTHLALESEKLLANKRECQKAWSVYMVLIQCTLGHESLGHQ